MKSNLTVAIDKAGRRVDLGLLVLRIGAGGSLFLKHGMATLTGYSTIVQRFPDPIHIGAHASLAYSLLADGVCSLLVVAGFFTRTASALILINLLTAFLFVHHGAFLTDIHAELVVLYIIVFSALELTGSGVWSVDERLKS